MSGVSHIAVNKSSSPPDPGHYERRLVFCLLIDMFGFTETGLQFTTSQLMGFNKQFVEQIKSHLHRFELPADLPKFQGDGWLLMTDDPKQGLALCNLADVLSAVFQTEMHGLTGIAMDRIPPLRLAICTGWDIQVVLPNGQRDWAGDSARKAVRASGWCQPNMILVDNTVLDLIYRDFYHQPLDEKEWPLDYRPKRDEQPFPKYILRGMKPEAAADPYAPAYFVENLKAKNQIAEAAEFALNASSCLENEAEQIRRAGKIDFDPFLVRWNKLLASSPNYQASREIFQNIRDAEIRPNVVTYNTLMNQAPDYSTARACLEEMRADGVLPDVVTFSTLMARAPDYSTAMACLEEMRADGVLPNVVTYSTVFKKDLSGQTAEGILSWYPEQPYHPEGPIQTVIASFRRAKRIDQAIRLVLDYPHLPAAKKVIKKHYQDCFTYFQSIFNQNPNHPNAAYALGIALLEIGDKTSAIPYLKKAHDLARPGARKTNLKKLLQHFTE